MDATVIGPTPLATRQLGIVVNPRIETQQRQKILATGESESEHLPI